MEDSSLMTTPTHLFYLLPNEFTAFLESGGRVPRPQLMN